MSQIECRTVGGEYVDAMSSVRCAKNLLLLVVLLCIAVQLAAAAAVEFYGVIDATRPAAAEAALAATQPTTSPSAQDASQAATVRGALFWLMPLTRFLAPVSAILAAAVLALAVLLVLVGHLGGARGYVSAFLWMLVLTAMLMPWQRMFHGTLASGALFGLDDLEREVARFRPAWGAGPVEMQTKVLHWSRFLGYPGVALLVWLLVAIKSAMAARKMKASTAVGGQA